MSHLVAHGRDQLPVVFGVVAGDLIEVDIHRHGLEGVQGGQPLLDAPETLRRESFAPGLNILDA